MNAFQHDATASQENSASGRDQRMVNLRRKLDDLDSLLGEQQREDRLELARAVLAADKTVKSDAGSAQPGGQPATPAPSARILMSDSVTVPASRTSLLPRSLDNRSLQLITRFAAGAIILGLEELVKRGQKWEEAAPLEVLTRQEPPPAGEDGHGDILRYWVLGMITSARRSVWSMALDALEAPGSLAGLIGRSTDRVMGTWLFRPVRRPATSAVNSVLNRLAAVSQAWIAEGRQEEQLSRWIASNGIDEIINDVIDMIAENPQLAALVSDQLSKQSMGIASAVADTGRKLGSVGDDVAENFARRLLRRGLRTEIAPITPKEELPHPMIESTK